jgi:hypothetical protein
VKVLPEAVKSYLILKYWQNMPNLKKIKVRTSNTIYGDMQSSSSHGIGMTLVLKILYAIFSLILILLKNLNLF